MRDIFDFGLPVLLFISFTISCYEYIKLSNQPPKNGASERLKITTVICFFSGLFIFFLHDRIEENYRSKVLIGYHSKLIEIDSGTEDYHSYYEYSSRDPRHVFISKAIYWMLILPSILFPIISFRWMNEISKLEDWEFKHFSNYQEREKEKKLKKEWYLKHPKRIKPLGYEEK